MAITVSALYYYPIKGCRGRSLPRGMVYETGFAHDCEWMVVDEQGMFVSQRSDQGLGIEIRSMCQIQTDVYRGVMDLTAPNMPALEVDLNKTHPHSQPVQVWRDTCQAYDEGEEASEWLTTFLSRERPGKYRLVRFRQDPTAGRKAKTGDSQIAFADAYPFLVISLASLKDLNDRLARKGHEALPMDRFRPNIVLSGCEPYEEDQLERLRIGDVELVGMTRCVCSPVTMTNQETAERGKEPLATLAGYRRNLDGNGVVFGRNFNFVGSGPINCEDTVQVLARKS